MTNYKPVLVHHGILGQKWGVRRYQNEDGSLTAAGKERYGDEERKAKQNKKAEKKFVKEVNAYQKNATKKYDKLYLESYNKTAEEYNSHKIDEYNKKHDPSDSDYYEKYKESFNKDWAANFDKMLLNEIKNDKHYKKAESIVNKYDDLSTSDLVEKHKQFINDFEKAVSSGKSFNPDSEKYKYY